MSVKIKLNIILFIFSFWGIVNNSNAHPMPNSVVVLNIHEKNISGEIRLPLAELQSAIGLGINDRSEKLVERLGDTLRAYFTQHIRPKSFEGKPWTVVLGVMKVLETSSQVVGSYKELIVIFTMTPPLHYDLRNFYFDYDVILHQVASHKILVAIKQDWQQGIVAEDDSTTQAVGVIALDVRSNTIKPFQISLGQGSTWQGFKNMVWLGIGHIIEGVDHILFILTLLLAMGPLTLRSRTFNTKFSYWGQGELLKIITAFTVGHSLTLLLGTAKWLNFSSQPIEVLIALTILISAFHALKPLYPQKEVFVAGGFGLIHGLAFSATLKNLELSTKQMLLSIFGFNVGIELMQLLIILMAFPILLFLSKTQYYLLVTKVGALAIITMALFWLIERW